MLGAIAGDTIGSVYEFDNTKTKDFKLFTPASSFTDDSILTVATAEVILRGERTSQNYSDAYKDYARRYPSPCGGYGARFEQWASSPSSRPYNSWGNGSAMRVSPVGWLCNSWDGVMAEAEMTAAVTHNHPEGIKGAQATAGAVYLARAGDSKAMIADKIEAFFGYDLDRNLDELRVVYQYNESCQATVPEAMIAFLAATDFEDAIRNAVSLGGDSDTLTCITGAIAEAFYGGVPEAIAQETLARLDGELKGVVEVFRDRYILAKM